MADLPLIDMTYIQEISGNDPMYIKEVTGIFLETMKNGLPKLQDLIMNTNDYEAIHKQAHFLKSSASIIRIRDTYENLVRIDAMSKQNTGLVLMQELVQSISINFNDALPELTELVQ
jgi:HPt (histidine-containing phosphotransfer) domain-containing protein